MQPLRMNGQLTVDFPDLLLRQGLDGYQYTGLAAPGPLVLVQNGNLTLGNGALIQNNRNQNNDTGKNWLGGGVLLTPDLEVA